MRTRVVAIVVFYLTVFLMAAPARAQYGAKPISNRATGETYHVEIGGYLWNPGPDIVITSEGLGQPGTPIDFETDLGIEKSTFKQLKVVLRASTKNKFRFEYTPISYESTATLQRDLVFNGVRYSIPLPVETELKWKAFRFGYEWDFLYRDRGFVGLLLDVKYTDVETSLTNAISFEFVHARAPIPAIGGIGRAYIAPNISITGEFSAFKWPESIKEDYGGKFYDFDLYGTVNFSDNFGAQLGYRRFDVFYLVDKDEGALKLKGIYFGGVARF